jgi:opacity protein-like surface antigen
MKKIIAVLAAAAALTASLYAGKNAEPAESSVVPVTVPFYIGVGGVMGMTSTVCPCAGNRAGKRIYDTSNFGGLLRVGYDFNPFFGIEARFLRSQLSRNFAKTTHYGIYAKPQVHLGDAVNVYALIGYGHTKVECDYRANPLYEGNGWSFGGGIEYDFGSGDGQGDAETGWGAFADYQNLLRDAGTNKVRSNVFSAGITYDF